MRQSFCVLLLVGVSVCLGLSGCGGGGAPDERSEAGRAEAGGRSGVRTGFADARDS